jgi:hypothetical protein
MNGKLALSFAFAAVILAAGGLFAVFYRLGALEERVADLPARSGTRAPKVEADPRKHDEAATDVLATKDPLAKLDHLVDALGKVDAQMYDFYTDLSSDLHQLKREVAQIEATLRQVIQGLGRPGGGGLPGFGWALAPRETPLDEATKRAYLEAAQAAGVAVEEGRVTVRGFLNMSPNRSMPIEHFMTRYPEAGHETLVHLIGKRTLEELRENPYGGLKGLPTALYKGMVAAGFREGVGTHPEPTSDPRNEKPRWILATGDVVYVACRYERGGATHVARATDWVIEDPAKGTVLPADCLRFTGSARAEDPDTGEAVLAAELGGFLVAVWPTPQALVEVALPSSLDNVYTYNSARIPPSEGKGILYLDVIFSKTPIAPEGEGALERLPDAPKDDGREGPR